MTAQSQARCLQLLMPFSELSFRLICKIICLTMLGLTYASSKHAPLFCLETSPGVSDVTLVEKKPADRHAIISWEQVSIFVIILQ